MSDTKSTKLLQQMTEKSKTDIQRDKRQYEDEIKKIEDDYYVKIEAKQKKIAEVEENLDKIKL